MGFFSSIDLKGHAPFIFPIDPCRPSRTSMDITGPFWTNNQGPEALSIYMRARATKNSLLVFFLLARFTHALGSSAGRMTSAKVVPYSRHKKSPGVRRSCTPKLRVNVSAERDRSPDVFTTCNMNWSFRSSGEVAHAQRG